MSSMHIDYLRHVALAASIGLTAVSSVRAQNVAGQAPTAAPDPVAAADARVDQAHAALEDASTHVSAISARLDADRQQGMEIRQRLSRGDSALPEIKAKIDSATARLSARNREMGLEDMHYAPLKFADDQVRLEAIGEFEKSPEYRAALQSINDAATAARAKQDDSLRRFAESDEYKQAVAAAGAPDGQAKLDALKERRLAADPNVAIAQNRVVGAKAALDELRKQFMEQQLPQIPKVADADQKLSAEQASYDVLANAAKAAEHDLAEGKAQLERQTTGLAADRATLAQLNTEITQLQNDLASAETAVSQMRTDVNTATASADAVHQSRDIAIAASQPVNPQPQLVYSSTSYEYAPPAVIYGGPVYVSTPYPYYGGFGGFAVVSSRGFIYAGGNHGYYGHADFHGGYGGHSVHTGNGGGAHR